MLHHLSAGVQHILSALRRLRRACGHVYLGLLFVRLQRDHPADDPENAIRLLARRFFPCFGDHADGESAEQFRDKLCFCAASGDLLLYILRRAYRKAAQFPSRAVQHFKDHHLCNHRIGHSRARLPCVGHQF